MVRKMIAIVGLWLLLALLNAPLITPSVQAQSPASQVFQLVNEVRANYGLAGFTYNSLLAAAAQEQANWMAANGQYVHNHGSSTPQTRAAAAGYIGLVSENIVGGTDLTGQQGVIWWQNSAIHFNTMISTRYTEAGVGVAAGFDQNFYVLVVGAPSDAPPAPDQVIQHNAPPAYVAPILLAQPGEDGSIVHTVLEGHTLWAIAARYEVPVETILLYNLTQDSLLQPGDKLLIRLGEGQEPPPTPTPPATHKVREGETAWTIAAKYRISLDEVFWLNNLTEDSILQPGDEVAIRLLPGQTPPPTPTPQLTHIVKLGDTLWSIALTYGLSLDTLLAYNSITADTMIREGQELYIRPPVIATETAVPTFTPLAHTPTPTAVAVAQAATATIPPSMTATAVSTTPTPPPDTASTDTGFNSAMLIGSIIAGIGLISLAGAAVITIRRNI
ncbi:MAG: LysM peptidoglycan-binding domain-containing protein [Chloroflexota bacterium]